MKEDQKLITVAEFDNSIDANLAKAILDDAGIESVVMGESIASSLYHVFDRYVKVQVFEKDADEARRLLNETIAEDDTEEDFS